MRRRTLGLSLAASLGLLGCGESGDGGAGSESTCEGSKCDDVDGDGDEARNVCVGIRGNGELIFAHFAALARIVEHYGLVSGASGGSSASITTFLLESVQMNPALYDCGERECTPAEAGVRASLLLKSIQGYAQVLADTDEIRGLRLLVPIAQQIQEQGIAALAETDPAAANEALVALLGSEELRDLVNPELLELLATSPDPVFHTRDIVGALQGLGSFDASDSAILVRPGLLDFSAIAEKVGRIASFYAGYGPWDADAAAAFLDACAEPARGKAWAEVAALRAGDTTCGEMFSAQLLAYREALLADEDGFASRVDDAVGGELPALISTSVLVDEGVDAWTSAREQYLAATEHTLAVDFGDVRFGYWGDASDLARVQDNSRGFTDAKTAKFHALGEATWREVLAFSPAEPGLARALELPDGSVSAGGWSDLHPVLVLDNLGCDEVVYVTRTGEESSFAQGVATLLGMTAADRSALYDLASDSAFDLSLREADAVWCTNWNELPASDIARVSDDAYAAPMRTEDPTFTEAADAYPNIDAGLDLVGCAPRSGAAG